MRLGDSKLKVGDVVRPVSPGPYTGQTGEVIKVEPFMAGWDVRQVTVRFADGVTICVLDIEFERVTAIERLAELSDD